MLLRSLYFVMSGKKRIRPFDFWIIIITLLSGLVHLLLELKQLDIISNRFPLGTFFWLGMAQVIYIQSKNRAESTFTIEDIIIKSYTNLQRRVLKKIASDSVDNDILWEELSGLEYNKEFVDKEDKKIAIMRVENPLPETHLIYAYMKPHGKFSKHNHSNADEHIYIVKGEVQELLSKEVYKEGDHLIIRAGKYHGFYANKESELRIHVAKVPTYKK